MADVPVSFHRAPGAAAISTPDLLHGLTWATALGAGAVGGVFFAFSTFVMKALEDLPPAQGLRAMQSINVAAPNPLFMTALFGTAVGCFVLAGVALRHPERPGSTLTLVAAACYLVVIGLTAAYHVPHNDALAAVDPRSAGAAAAWHDYAGPWTLLNHVRTVGSLAAAGLLTWAAKLD
ncbi:MAG: anthrone oxygenase family protein [Solirubrobacteraceae bacterium]|nr:DUF1772 domain-containing protein [Patulibacter sp.]